MRFRIHNNKRFCNAGIHVPVRVLFQKNRQSSGDSIFHVYVAVSRIYSNLLFHKNLFLRQCESVIPVTAVCTVVPVCSVFLQIFPEVYEQIQMAASCQHSDVFYGRTDRRIRFIPCTWTSRIVFPVFPYRLLLFKRKTGQGSAAQEKAGCACYSGSSSGGNDLRDDVPWTGGFMVPAQGVCT